MAGKWLRYPGYHSVIAGGRGKLSFEIVFLNCYVAISAIKYGFVRLPGHVFVLDY